MAKHPCILELYINNEKVDEVRCFGSNSIEQNKLELKKVWQLSDESNYEMWLVYRPDVKEKINE